jgi:tetratricopeptide (TPR) repeat protein
MTIETEYSDYRALVESEAPLGLARHFVLGELLGSGYSLGPERDTLRGPALPPLPLHPLGQFQRADNSFRWTDGPLLEGLRALAQSKEGFALLSQESYDADAVSPFELAAACSALMTPAAAFWPVITSGGFQLFLVAEAPLQLARLSLTGCMATLREALRICQTPWQQWAPGLLHQLGFTCQPEQQGIRCQRGEELFLWNLAGERPELLYGPSQPRLIPVPPPGFNDLLRQGVVSLDESRDPQATRQALQEAVALDPQDFEAQLALGRLELGEGRLEQAELRLLLATLLRPDQLYAHSLLGDCYAMADKIPQAIAVQQRLLMLDPGNESARENLERLQEAL